MAFDPSFGRVAPRGTRLKVTSGWGTRRAGTPREHVHRGLDIPLPEGTPIFAAAEGTISRVDLKGSSDAGIYVEVIHPSALASRYLHLSRADVRRGQRVSRGDQIGLSGTTGLSEAPHLHFDLIASPAVLPAIAAVVGEPRSGLGGSSGIGVFVPAEPWLPVDEYAPRVVAAARSQGIPLFHERPRAPDRRLLVAVAGGAALSFAALLWLAGRADETRQ